MTLTFDPRNERISTPEPDSTETPCDERSAAAPRIDVVEVSQHVKSHQTLHNVSFAVRPGEIVAIAGGSGAGKTTLLEAMVGIRPATSGWVLIDGRELDQSDRGAGFGYVPQDDIIHLELPLRRTLEHAAALRMPTDSTSEDIEAAVARTLEQLDLQERADVPVKSLSGGQRKRASIASELLTDPRLFLLDEPTSGLDPATGASVMNQLRDLSNCGTTIVLTTHAPADLARCDRIVFLARDGHLAFVGTPTEAREYFDVDDLTDVYELLASVAEPAELTSRFIEKRGSIADETSPISSWPRVAPKTRTSRPVGAVRQWRALTRRNVDLVWRNKLTLAILLGSPAMVVAMTAVLFKSGTFSVDQISPMPAIQTLFWVAFASFFFGVTYGLLQVVGEFAIFRRERFSGLSVGAYVASKVTVLTPLLVIVNITMLAILRSLGRLPSTSVQNWAQILVGLVLVSLVALSMGLLASSAVQNPAQATLALPMLCFPQVLFAGAVVPIAEMAGAGRFMSFGLANRWGFESVGRTLGIGTVIGDDTGSAGYLGAFSGPASNGWIVLSVITIVMLVSTTAVLHRRSRVVQASS